MKVSHSWLREFVPDLDVAPARSRRGSQRDRSVLRGDHRGRRRSRRHRGGRGDRPVSPPRRRPDPAGVGGCRRRRSATGLLRGVQHVGRRPRSVGHDRDDRDAVGNGDRPSQAARRVVERNAVLTARTRTCRGIRAGILILDEPTLRSARRSPTPSVSRPTCSTTSISHPIVPTPCRSSGWPATSPGGSVWSSSCPTSTSVESGPAADEVVSVASGIPSCADDSRCGCSATCRTGRHPSGCSGGWPMQGCAPSPRWSTPRTT